MARKYSEAGITLKNIDTKVKSETLGDVPTFFMRIYWFG